MVLKFIGRAMITTECVFFQNKFQILFLLVETHLLLDNSKMTCVDWSLAYVNVSNETYSRQLESNEMRFQLKGSGHQYWINVLTQL